MVFTRSDFAVVVFLVLAAVVAMQPLAAQAPQTAKAPPSLLPDYILGPNDELMFMSVLVEELNDKRVRIGTSGDVSLAMVGRVRAAGMTVEQFQTIVNEKLKTQFKEPDVAINVTEQRSQPVSVFGSVMVPGVKQVEGNKTLIEVLAEAGGLRDDAGSTIKITRRLQAGTIPLASAKTEGEYSIAEIDIRSIQDATRPQDNIRIMANDLITVTQAELVTVIGAVHKPGRFTLEDRKGLSLIEALARAEGPVATASLKSATILRPLPGSKRVEIKVNLQDVLKGKAQDTMLQPDDILVVPDSYAKGAFRRTLETALQVATGMAIYR